MAISNAHSLHKTHTSNRNRQYLNCDFIKFLFYLHLNLIYFLFMLFCLQTPTFQILFSLFSVGYLLIKSAQMLSTEL